jgi:regulatory protein
MLLKPDVLEKLARFASYRERSEAEIRSKLDKLQIPVEEHDNYVARLLDLDILNHDRFCRSYIRGKFRIKSWGRIKIRAGLRQKGISNDTINPLLEQEIDEEEYLSKIDELLGRKSEKLKEKNFYKRKASLMRYLQQRGFETDLIFDRINQKDK